MRTIDAELLSKTLQARADQDILHNIIGGAAMRVMQQGQTVCEVYRGYKNVATQEPLTPGTLFRLASMTKPVSGIACLIGMERGWFSLTDRVADHLPAYERMRIGKLDQHDNPVADRTAKKDIRIWHLLTHSSGLVSADDFGIKQMQSITKKAHSIAEAVDFYAEHTYLSFEPGEAAAYSGAASFDVLARIIEMYSHMPYADFVRTHIFEPLGIKDIVFTPTNQQWARMITMYEKADTGGVPVDMGRHTFEDLPLSYTCAGASLVGTLEDYCIFAEMLRRGGEYRGVRIVSPSSLGWMQKPYITEGTPGRMPTASWGLGVRVVMGDAVLPDGAFGWSGAYGTHFWVDPVNQITAVYLKNSRWHDSHGCGETGLQFERDVMAALI